MSNVFYYQTELDSLFLAFFRSQKTSTKTQVNYKSDIKHFFTWLLTRFEQSHVSTKNMRDLLCLTTSIYVDEYKHESAIGNTPIATINRRLSAVRKFFQYIKDLGYITDNPTEHINNISQEKHTKQTARTILNEFEQALIQQGAAET